VIDLNIAPDHPLQIGHQDWKKTTKTAFPRNASRLGDSFEVFQVRELPKGGAGVDIAGESHIPKIARAIRRVFMVCKT
jgi:hypothetical protein